MAKETRIDVGVLLVPDEKNSTDVKARIKTYEDVERIDRSNSDSDELFGGPIRLRGSTCLARITTRFL